MSGLKSEISDENVQKLLKNQEKALNLAKKTEMKNVANLAMQDASNYVKESMDKLIKVLSKEHRFMAMQFIQFRGHTFLAMDKMEGYYNKLLDAELCLA